ncbi:outer membrane beta-barrel protein [Salibacter halophilus]|uniref:PorT family protein n=1 Tax=Salibacter halophilus TaxID=1803916 RepID=A0A6N6M6U2_9FLAO|nr:outer membrane beta-barrel protein [Salibacter halophilus]KAB1065632.1 PorT family protein [Salibacter halophilus]
MAYRKLALLITAPLFIFIASLAHAQKGLFLSLKGMPQASAMLVKDSYQYDEHTVDYYFGNASGFEVGYNFNDTIGVSLEFLFSKEGNRYRYRFDSLRYDIRERYEYLRIPIQFVFNGDPTNVVSFRAKMGPSINILRNANVVYYSNLLPTMTKKETYFKDITISWAMNVGLAFNVTDYFSIDAGIRSDYSLTNARRKYLVLNTLYSDGDNEKSYRPFILAFEIGARFKL